MGLIKQRIISGLLATGLVCGGVGIATSCVKNANQNVNEDTRNEFILNNTNTSFDLGINLPSLSSVDKVIFEYKHGLMTEELFKNRINKFSAQELDDYASTHFNSEQYAKFVKMQQTSESKVDSYKTASTILYSISGAAFVSALSLALVERKEEEFATPW